MINTHNQLSELGFDVGERGLDTRQVAGSNWARDFYAIGVTVEGFVAFSDFLLKAFSTLFDKSILLDGLKCL